MIDPFVPNTPFLTFSQTLKLILKTKTKILAKTHSCMSKTYWLKTYYCIVDICV